MGYRKRSRLKSIDWTTFSIFLGLIAVGWLMIFTVGYEDGEAYKGGLAAFLRTPAGKQTIWIGISFIVFWFIILIDYKFWQTFAYPIYFISLGLLVAVLFFGITIKGATSWFSFGGFSFQPSEVAKFGTCLAMSSYLSSFSTQLKNLQSQLLAALLFLGPMLLILLQPDAGSALVFISFLIVLYRAGLSGAYYLVGFFTIAVLLVSLVTRPVFVILFLIWGAILMMAASTKEKRNYWLLSAFTLGVIAFIATRFGFIRETFFASAGLLLVFGIYLLALGNQTRLLGGLTAALVLGGGLSVLANYAFNNVLQPHQQDRINVWLRPDQCDPQGALYNVLQSKMAIGSGGWKGKGFLNGTMTKLNYVPEQSTDFIFCTVGEEQGFIGSFAVIALFLLLLVRLTIIAERQRFSFSRYYAYCVAGIIFVHFFINIGMTMGLMPIIGIPLPFISKGGSSLLGFSIMIAVLLKLDSSRYRI